MLPGCNSSDSTDYEYTYSSSVLVSAFSLEDDDDVLDSLQNVYFTIDLADYKIYNADSLPYGTNVSRLICSITTAESVSALTLAYPREGQSDSIVDYLTNSTDSIDFSLGAVTMTVTSASGAVTKAYEVKVNVHQTKPDTLAWNSIQAAEIPTSLKTITAQRTAELNGTYYCLTQGEEGFCLATTNDPADPDWQTREISLDFEPEVNTLRQSDDALFMLSADGDIYSSDDCEHWTAIDSNWLSIYGAYGNQIMGCKRVGDELRIISYPDGQEWDFPEDFPVTGCSVPVLYATAMGSAPQLSMTGGYDAQGKMLTSTWGFDGENWANITRASLPKPVCEMAVVPYDLFSVSSSTWAPVQYPALIAIGGVGEYGINRVVYYSRDWGMTWAEAPDLMQLSDEVPVYMGSSAFVHSTTMYLSRAQSGWSELAVRKLYPQCHFLAHKRQSRVTEAITQWECPAIYVMGGYQYDGTCVNSVWRGVILRYTFDPVY